MKVVYKKTIVEKIQDEIERAARIGKTIDHIVLTEDEWEQAKRELNLSFRDTFRRKTNQICGVEVVIQVEDDF